MTNAAQIKGVELVDAPMAASFCRIQFFKDIDQNLLDFIERKNCQD
jgi:hypothetical protein